MSVKYVAMKLIAFVDKGSYSNIVLNDAFREFHFTAKEKAFITEIFYGVLRNKNFLDSTPRLMPRPRIVSNQLNLTPHSPPIASLRTYSQEIHRPRYLHRLRSPNPVLQTAFTREV